MTDHELLEAAAKAAGVEIHESDDGTLQRRPVWAVTHYVQGQPYGEHRWDPLHDDGDALRLAGMLGEPLSIDITTGGVTIVSGFGFDLHEPHGADSMAATRRAIVRAAAAIPPPPRRLKASVRAR